MQEEADAREGTDHLSTRAHPRCSSQYHGSHPKRGLQDLLLNQGSSGPAFLKGIESFSFNRNRNFDMLWHLNVRWLLLNCFSARFSEFATALDHNKVNTRR
ncbi:hypothetical protein FHG87_003252 [Trinorchestia longiramus]|nr:hypothetical protein FHG87_003252 [Trinorchestia longiramus]